MNSKTITLNGVEQKISINGRNCWIRNDSNEILYAAGKADYTPGDDGGISIPIGGSAPVYDANGTVYLQGNGIVTVIGSDYTENPFKSVGSNGGGTDATARAAISAHTQNAGIHITAQQKAAWNVLSNPNLLDNPDFAINQRQKNSYTSDGAILYAVDRWRMQNYYTLEVSTHGVIIYPTRVITSISTAILQDIAIPHYIENLPLTLSFSGTGTEKAYLRVSAYNSDGASLAHTEPLAVNSSVKSITMESVPSGTTKIRVALNYDIGAEANDLCNLQWIKLELGNTATPFMPPVSSTELAKCQCYYQIHSSNNISEADLRPTMFSTPVITQLDDGNYSYDASK